MLNAKMSSAKADEKFSAMWVIDENVRYRGEGFEKYNKIYNNRKYYKLL